MTDVNFNNLKVIFIDWYLTLTSATFLNKLKIENNSIFKKFINVIFENNSEGWQYDWARGKLNKEDAAKKIAHAGVLTYEKVLQTFADCCSHQNLDYPETLNIIKDLRNQGIKVILATDNWDIFCQYTVPSLQLDKHFDEILSSCEQGFLKRDISNAKLPFFASYLQKHDIKTSETLLIDDALVNIDACKKTQIPAVQVSSCAETKQFLEYILKEIKCKKN